MLEAIRTRGLSGRAYANTAARPALRRANVVEETRLHVGCCDHAGARHRREHGDLQRGQRRAVAFFAVRWSRPSGLSERASSAVRGDVNLLPGFHRLARAEPRL